MKVEEVGAAEVVVDGDAGSCGTRGRERTVVSSMRLQMRFAGAGWSWPGCCGTDFTGRYGSMRAPLITCTLS